ncbi:MAG: hypothetical protein HZB16_15870 [Armatimonadetes bacterium]|nr:hypothetical protein [Armatimonadota bacterium]
MSWLVCFALGLCLGGARAEDKPAAAAPAAAPSKLQQSGGALVLPGEYYRSTLYQGTDPVTGQGNLTWKYGEGVGLFSSRPGQATQTWQVNYRGEVPRHGLQVGFNVAEADRRVAAAEPLGVASGEMGVRRADYSASWKGRTFNLTFDGGRTSDLAFGTGLGRELMSVSALGAWYSRERLAIDDTLKLESAAHDRLLSKEGYGLGSRSRGSGGGFTNLNALTGLKDDYQEYGYKTGRLSVSRSDRVLDRNGVRVSDVSNKIGFGPVTLARSTRRADQDAAWLREAGYGSLMGLRGGHEDNDSVEVNLKALSATWSKVRQVQGTSGSDSEERAFTLRPFDGVELGYGHRDLWGSSPQASDQVQLSVARGRHKLALTAESSLSGASAGSGAPGNGAAQPTTGEVLRRLEASYQMGRAITLRYTGNDSTERSDSTWRATHQATIETGAGLVARGRLEVDPTKPDGHYVGATLDRKLMDWWSVQAAYDQWGDTTDSSFQIAGRSKVLGSGVDNAWHYRVGTTVKPGRSQVGAERRTLWWRQPTATAQYAEGPHSLSESSVNLTQPLLFGLRARGTWSFYESDQALDRENREAALAFAPGGKSVLEMGYRESRSAGGLFTPTAFVTATFSPWRGLTMQGEVQQNAGTNSDWTADSRRTVKVAATHKLLGTGEAKVAFERTPGDLSSASAVTPGQSVTVDVATPENFMFNGLRLLGHWQTRHDAGNTLTAMIERSATLSWDAKWLGALKATYTESGAVGPLSVTTGRLALEYSKTMGTLGRFVVSGWVEDLSNRLEAEAVREKYRVGVHYELPL